MGRECEMETGGKEEEDDEWNERTRGRKMPARDEEKGNKKERERERRRQRERETRWKLLSTDKQPRPKPLMATQICALAGVLIHCGFPTSFSESSSRLRASISKRVSLFTNDHCARIFHSRFFNDTKSFHLLPSRKRKAEHDVNKNRSPPWLNFNFNSIQNISSSSRCKDSAKIRRANLLSTRNEILSPCRSSHASFPGIFIAAALPKSVNRHRGPRVRAISNRYRAITAAKNERRNTVSVVRSLPPDKSWPACN